jgi:hypothetical protein
MSEPRFSPSDRVRVTAETPNLGRRVIAQYVTVPLGAVGAVDYYPSGRKGETIVTVRLDAGHRVTVPERLLELVERGRHW